MKDIHSHCLSKVWGPFLCLGRLFWKSTKGSGMLGQNYHYYHICYLQNCKFHFNWIGTILKAQPQQLQDVCVAFFIHLNLHQKQHKLSSYHLRAQCCSHKLVFFLINAKFVVFKIPFNSSLLIERAFMIFFIFFWGGGRSNRKKHFHYAVVLLLHAAKC